MKTPAVLLILDGYGLAKPSEYNAVENADTPTLKRLREQNSCRLQASGKAVGLRKGLMGSSEVNHLNIGAGRVVEQDILRIDNAIANGKLARNPALLEALGQEGNIHFVGLLSDGGVHSHIDHLRALLDIASKHKDKVYLHAILDGRDTEQRAAHKWLSEMDNREDVEIASIHGRYYAMDRDHRWERTKISYDVMIGEGPSTDSWEESLQEDYSEGLSDEFVKPRLVGEAVKDGDAIIFFNFRSDRPRQLTEAFTKARFEGFDRTPPQVSFIQMTEYDSDNPLPTLFPSNKMKNVLGEWLSKHSVTQLRIAETEKYAHATFFFNGGQEEPFEGEDRIIVPSPSVATYDQQPEMSVDEITDKVVDDLDLRGHHVYIINFANSDMVGHTGDYQATIKALEAIDRSVKRLEKKVLEKNGFLIVTADHGNAEDMHADATTTHTTNPVPMMLVGVDKRLRDGIIPDVAPTFLDLIGLDKPDEMTGRSLILKDSQAKH